MNPIAIITYTHSNCKDIWHAYFDRLDRYIPNTKSYVFSNVFCEEYEKHKFICYDDNLPYSKEYANCLRQIEEEYVIYMQEDFILYSQVNLHVLMDYLKRLQSDSDISYIRLLRCGDVTKINHSENLYYISPNGRSNNSINSFSMQPTIWRKSDLIKLYELTNRNRFGEHFDYTKSMNQLNMNGLYHYANEPRRGGHFDSNVFPYIATAVVRGKWNVGEYPSELKDLFKEYKISFSKRGTI